MSWQDFKEKGRIVEENFAKHLENPVWANKQQDMFEHWDLQGTFKGKLLKFDVKGMKKKNRFDNKFQDDIAWIEGTNVWGKPGWIKGKADYICFERNDYWLVVNREELYNFVVEKVKENGAQQGKGIYKVYQREGRQDKITMVPFEDIEKLIDIHKVKK
jgi:penicillin-binding protein-related factor A (putative recombinase)